MQTKRSFVLLVFFIAVLSLTIASMAHRQGRPAAPSNPDEKPVTARFGDRDYPSVFQAWSRVENLPNVSRMEGIARHDLAWNAISLCGLRWDKHPGGLAAGFTPESIRSARKVRRELLALNPNLILIAEIRYRDAHSSFLPQGHKWWRRDDQGRIVKGWEEGRFLQLDYKNPEYRRHVAQRAKAVVESGVADGILLDWWHDDDDRLALVKEIRAAIGDKPLVIANTNDRTAPKTGAYLNGFFMECYRSETADQWGRIAQTLAWAEKNLRPPRVNCVEVWFQKSRRDLDLMRAVTTLTLTHSDGYCLFSDPNPLPTPDHRHNWYPFWDKGLGKPLAAAVTRPDGATMREYANATVVYNPMGNGPVEVTFASARTSRATGKSGATHTLPDCDGDIYLKNASR